MDYLVGKGLKATGKLMGLGTNVLGKIIGAPYNLIDKVGSKFIDIRPRYVEVIVPDELTED
jgi:hypothetical protein